MFSSTASRINVILICAILLTATPVVVSAQDGPCLYVNPKLLNFYINNVNDCISSADIPGDQFKSIVISNCGDGELNWHASQTDAWVVIEPDQGANFDSVSIGVIASKLPDIFPTPNMGDTVLLQSSIVIEAPGATGSPQEILVNVFLVCEEESISLLVDPRYFYIRLPEYGQTTERFKVWEQNGRDVIVDFSNRSNWLTLPLFFAAVHTPAVIEFGVSANGLAPGIYHDTISIYSSGSETRPPTFIPVTLTVGQEIYRVETDPEYFVIETVPGDNVIRESIDIYETGGANIPFHWESAHRSEWLYLPLEEKLLLTPNTFEFEVSAAGLVPGVYRDTIIIYYPYDDIYGFDDVRVPVDFIVTSGDYKYWVLTEPSKFDLTVLQDKYIIEKMHVYEINNHNIPFYYNNTQPWLVVEPLDLLPDMTPYDLKVIAHAGGMEPGIYHDTITIFPTSRTEDFMPHEVPVSMRVIIDTVYFGDANRDYSVNVSDAVYLINYIFHNGPAPSPVEAGDANQDDEVNVGDVVHVLREVFNKN